MKKNNFKISWLIIIVALLLLAAEASATFFVNKQLFAGEIILLCAFAVFAVALAVHQGHLLHKSLDNIVDNLSSSDREVLEGIKMPVLVINAKRDIVWYSDIFRQYVLSGNDMLGRTVSAIIPEQQLEQLHSVGRCEVTVGKRCFNVYMNIGLSGEGEEVYYFIDITKYRAIAREYARSRPSVMIIAIDNLNEIMNNAKDSQKAALTGEIERLLEDWASLSTGFLRKTGSNMFVMVVEEIHLKKYIDDGFDILKKVRTLKVLGISGATLSIGVGRGAKTLHESEIMAKQALDMALGRGGDHAVVKNTSGEYEFYGGVSGGVEQRTKVRTRIIASSIKGMIASSENVFVMGHRYGDLDSLGSSIGVWKIARDLGKEAYILANRKHTLAGQLMERFDNAGNGEYIISAQRAEQLIKKRTLLIVVDTHRPDFLEYPDIYRKLNNIIVIDHHRKTVDHIDNAIIFYHEPYASSASEMVSELVQYIDGCDIGKQEAEALLAGIMLDSRNFVIRTGVRTFEAAGFLRGKGANPVDVKSLFASSLTTYKLKTTIVSAAEKYKNTAISFVEEESENSRLASAQAADELLGIEGVSASFVIFKQDGIYNISARSLGDVNVQLIMEELGGGGHQTMAASQLKCDGMSEAKARLCLAIDNYLKKNS